LVNPVKAEETATHIVEWDEEVDNLPAEILDDYIRTLDYRPHDGTGKLLFTYS
jgi:hypothetical protein